MPYTKCYQSGIKFWPPYSIGTDAEMIMKYILFLIDKHTRGNWLKKTHNKPLIVIVGRRKGDEQEIVKWSC